MMNNNTEKAWYLHEKKCTGCGDCMLICPVKAIEIKKKKAVLIDPESCCRESCRICEYLCAEGAITAY
jgi:NAD-dependent dihydropyrimidine dehydrogenase PreA subunit